ncbi:unnamed protein product [Gordionus sp. m RMFG-2023]
MCMEIFEKSYSTKNINISYLLIGFESGVIAMFKIIGTIDNMNSFKIELNLIEYSKEVYKLIQDVSAGIHEYLGPIFSLEYDHNLNIGFGLSSMINAHQFAFKIIESDKNAKINNMSSIVLIKDLSYKINEICNSNNGSENYHNELKIIPPNKNNFESKNIILVITGGSYKQCDYSIKVLLINCENLSKSSVIQNFDLNFHVNNITTIDILDVEYKKDVNKNFMTRNIIIAAGARDFLISIWDIELVDIYN